MALTQTWVLQGTTPTTIDATDYIAFSDGTFGNPILVGSYQDGTHVRSSGGADDSSGNTPNNVKYVASGTCDIGAGTINVSTVTNAQATLKITISETSAITLSDVSFYAYDGTTTTTAPTDTDVYAFQATQDSAWTNCDGSAAALTLDGSAFLDSATSHDAYVAVSVSPSAVGIKSSNKLRIEFTYQ